MAKPLARASSLPEHRLRMLLVEDSIDDADLVLRAMRRSGVHVEYVRVETRLAFLDALNTGTWDVIVSDHTLPSYGGLHALSDLRATGKDIPFILVSGTVGEEVAVKAMKAGAQDYVLKGDLTRLPVAVEREVREAAVRAEQARMRRQLVISERMASAGMLAAGVAHEINNPLAIAMANVEMLSGLVTHARGTDGHESASVALDEIVDPLRDAHEALVRIRDIVRDVKLFSRVDDEGTGVIDVRRVIDSSVRMARNEIRHRARVVLDCDGVPFVRGNESRLGQVILNLLVNAAHALDEGRANQNEIRVSAHAAETGSVVIQVVDTGCGIPRENLERIFDPFFTTKPVGIGTGLGLAICHGIVSDLGGRITVDSEVGKGTAFRIELPAASADSGVMRTAAAAADAQHVARVLIVDDEVAIARALGRNLEPHEVTALSRGSDAIALIGGGVRFDAIVLDVMMPEMSGMDVYESLLKSHPDQAARVVFITGGVFSPSARDFLQRVENPKVDKPIDTAALRDVIDKLAQG